MFKALLRKQLLSLFSGIFQDKRRGKRRGVLGTIGFAFIFVILFFSIFMMYMGLSDALCDAFVSAGMAWLYFAMMGLMGLVVAVIGSAFMSYSALFQAKDNELLMSMPIPAGAILFTRMLVIWFMGFLFELPAIAAAFIQYRITTGSGNAGIAILLTLFTSFFILALCCLLGWLVAILMSKVSNKNTATVVFTLVFLGGYYAIYFRIQKILQEIIAAGDRIGSAIKGWVYPVYQFGLAGSGDWGALVKYCLICVVTLAIVYWVISKSFIKIATANHGAVKKEYKATEQKAESLGKALIRKELRHFVNSPAYLLNAGLGIIAMPILAVVLFVKRSALLPALPILEQIVPGEGMIAIGCLAVCCLLTTLNDITAPSISIEGKTLWITQSMPIDLKEFLMAKERLQLLLTCIPAIFPVIACALVFKVNLVNTILMLAGVMTFIEMMAALGLALNLKMPKLDWANETAAVKSSLSALIAIFGGWALAALPVLGVLLLRRLGLDVTVQVQLIIWVVIFTLVARLLNSFIIKKGPEIIRSL